jgi:hypothetical protein
MLNKGVVIISHTNSPTAAWSCSYKHPQEVTDFEFLTLDKYWTTTFNGLKALSDTH